MATAKQIKSAIRSQSSAKRGMMSSLADVSSSLLSAQESSKMFDIKQQQKESMYNFAYSGLELAETISGGIQQKRETAQGVERFKEALSPDLKKDFRMKKTSLSDVLKGKKGSLTSYLTGKQEYFLGDKSLGSQYDVSARGDEIFSKKLAKNLLDMTEGESLMDRPTPTLPSMQEGYGTININKLGKMKPSTMQVNQEPSEYRLGEKDYKQFGDVNDEELSPVPQSVLDLYS